MKTRRVSIRLKFMATIVFAIMLPLLIGMISLEVFGSRYFTRQKGLLFQMMGEHIAAQLEQSIHDRERNLELWLSLHQFEELRAFSEETMTEMERYAVQEIDARWATLGLDDPLITGIMDNSMSLKLRELQERYPRFVEIFLTDKLGRLVAATNKTTDYDQSDEQWWIETIRMERQSSWMEGVHTDESAQIMSVDISMPVYLPGGTEPAGVLKAVLNIKSFFSQRPNLLEEEATQSHVILEDGRVLVNLNGDTAAADLGRISGDALAWCKATGAGFTIKKAFGQRRELLGVAPLTLRHRDDQSNYGWIAPMHVLVHRDIEAVQAPVNRQIQMLSIAGIVLIAIFSSLAIYIAQKKIIQPIQILREAAIRLGTRISEGTEDAPGSTTASDSTTTLEDARQALAAVEDIQTNDEYEDLAQGFTTMGRRILDYHTQLEAELSHRVEEVRRDLKVARDFQQSLLPQVYPPVPSNGFATPVSLRFHHVYRPTLSVGGDFFDVFRMNETKAGVFIADVMGHGARSALIGAILRTLLQNYSLQYESPANVLQMMNERFFNLLPNETEKLFASALYMVIDTRNQTIQYSIAGHPSPLRVSADRRGISTMIPPQHYNPALGLVPGFEYQGHTTRIEPGEICILYTDGVLEALNPRDEEFGMERLRNTISGHIHSNAMQINEAIESALHRFMDTVISPDDICLLSIEAIGNAVPAEPVQH